MIEVGDRVLLQMGASAFSEAPKGLQRWDGCQFIVSKKKTIRNQTYFELKACRSVKGISYTIMEEWITPMR